MTDLQALLAHLIHSAGRTQVDLAHEAGISEKHLSEMLNGHAEGSLSVWQRLLDAAGVRLPEFAS